MKLNILQKSKQLLNAASRLVLFGNNSLSRMNMIQHHRRMQPIAFNCSNSSRRNIFTALCLLNQMAHLLTDIICKELFFKHPEKMLLPINVVATEKKQIINLDMDA